MQNPYIGVTPLTPPRTAFSDIADEWKSCSAEERQFIEQDPSYIEANAVYTQQFSSFLIDTFGLQFLNSPAYGKSVDQVLAAIRQARARYRTAAVDDLAKVKQENLKLQQELKELKERVDGHPTRSTTQLI